MRTRVVVPCMLLFACLFTTSYSQPAGSNAKGNIPPQVLEHLKKNKKNLELEDSDIADLAVSDQYTSKHSGVQHVYVIQRHKGIEIHGAVTNVNLSKEGKVLSMGNRFHKSVEKKIKGNDVKLSAADAVAAAAMHLKTPLKEALTVKQAPQGASRFTVFSPGGISVEPIPARLIYQPLEDGTLVLTWEVSIYELDQQNWWNIRVHATTGEILDKDNLVVRCEFDHDENVAANHTEHRHSFSMVSGNSTVSTPLTNVYNVYPMPVESPNHGERALVSGSAADRTASPLGWHSTGTETFTITRGNNVYAYEDPNNTGYAQGDLYGHSPDGGASLVFDFPVDFTKEPVFYRDAAITNLFYWNNVIHDVWYQYGFDEASGNFQTNNFGRGGLEGDHVMAEAQDSRNIPTTRNNANFATPRDGIRPRMQMYLWSGKPDPDRFRVISPTSIAGSYPAVEAAFSLRLTRVPLVGKLVLMNDGLTNPEACTAITNPEEIAGNIAVVYRGTCTFAAKVERAQLAGAIAVVVINNVAGDPIVMGGTPTIPITIPAVMISQASGAIIRAEMNGGSEVTVALKNEPGPEVDGDFDNAIIVHEYGHGISIRLTGGPSVVNCLNNAEQAGEGWSDWFGLMMTMREGDQGSARRGVGTYPLHQSTTGQGIRPAPYSTSFAENPYTYGATNNSAISQPHGIGFVFATMLWDMTWALVDKYGFDSDLYSGRGGNNIAMQLVIDGLKLQPCSPGFVDSRDAILLADRINYGGANQELLWKVFARRGLGYSAKQGLSTSRFDQVEAFDLPPFYLCQTPLTITPIPSNNIYTGGVPTTLYLGYGPESVTLQASGDATNTYSWTPATGLNSSTIANPVFTPTQPGTYTFTVKAVNADMCTKRASITITVIDVRCGKKGEKVLVCVNGDNPCVSSSAVPRLLNDGGTLGSCSAPNAVLAEETSLEPGSEEETASIGNYPNPFSESTTVIFTVPHDGYASLRIYEMVSGKEVATLFDGVAEKGRQYAVEFNASNRRGGAYIYKLFHGDAIKTGMMILHENK